MQTLRLVRRASTWIAVLAVLMAALAPAISDALGDPNKAPWVEVCTTQGSKWFNAQIESTGDSTPELGHTLDHCPYCPVHANAVGIWCAPLQAVPAPALAPSVLHAFLAAPRTVHAWLSAPPRAPPSVS